MKKKLMVLASLMITFQSWSQSNEQAKQIVGNLCGCFEVDFKYVETFSPDPEYKFHLRDESGPAAELALPLEVSDKRIVIQHLLVVSPTTVVKHWREEWTYENPVMWKYLGERQWEKVILPADQVKGKWTQSVWEVADEPRYQGISSFVNLDNRVVWQSTTDAPLPRREYSVRDDYNVLRRTNRISFTVDGYVHEQDNQKIIRNGNSDSLLVEEKGFNTYRKVDEKECAAAREYWEKNKNFWARVRTAWQDLLSKGNVIALENKIDGKFLHERLLALSREAASGALKLQETDQRILAEIRRYVRPTPQASPGVN